MLNANKIICLVFGIAPLVLSQDEEAKYHSNEQVESILKNMTETINDGLKTRLYSIGKSKGGTDLWVLEMTTAEESRVRIPNVKLIGTVHRNEPVGREILLKFAHFLRDNYKNDAEIAWLLNNTKIHIVPNLNPDGFVVIENEDGDCRSGSGPYQDLNTNFPDFFHRNPHRQTVETEAVIKWMNNYAFVLSAAFYGGQVVANYPFDSATEITGRRGPSLTPDDDVFKHLASVYAENHSKMFKGNVCKANKSIIMFKGGISNGANFSSFFGSMADYNYFQHGCMELRIDISCCKYPYPEKLTQLWTDNKKALVKFCSEAHRGITGHVFDETTKSKPIQNASLKITGRNMTFFTKNKGDFWRLLLPGRYNLEIVAAGYHKKNVSFEVKNQTGLFPELTTLEIGLLNLSLPLTTISPLPTTILPKINTEFVVKATTEIEQEMNSEEVRDYYNLQDEEGPRESALEESGAEVMQKSIILYCLFAVSVLI